jgi:CHAT domain-containing protein
LSEELEQRIGLARDKMKKLFEDARYDDAIKFGFYFWDNLNTAIKGVDGEKNLEKLIMEHDNVRAQIFAFAQNLVWIIHEVGNSADALPVLLRLLVLLQYNENRQKSEILQTLDSLLILYQEMNKTDETISTLLQIIGVLQKIEPVDKKLLALTLEKLASNYDKSKDDRKSEPLYVEARKLYCEIAGQEDWDYLAVTHNLFMIYSMRYDSLKADPLFQELEVIYLKKLSAMSQELYRATIHHNLGILYFTKGDYPKAEKHLSHAKNIWDKHRILNESYLKSITHLSEIYSNQEDVKGEEKILRELVNCYASLQKEKTDEHAECLKRLAVILYEKGEYSEAEVNFTKYMGVKNELYGSNSVEFALAMNNLADIYQIRQDDFRANALYDDAEAIITNSVNPADLNNDQAWEYAVNLNNHAWVHLKYRDYEAGECLLNKAIDIYKRLLLNNEKNKKSIQQRLATAFNNLSIVYKIRYDFVKAKSLCQEARNIWKESGKMNSFDYASITENLADIHNDLGEHSDAIPLYNESRQIYEDSIGRKHEDYASNLVKSSISLVSCGEKELALNQLRESRLIEEMIQGKILDFSSTRQRMTSVNSTRKHQYIFLSLVMEYFSNSEDAKNDAFELLLKNKARTLDAFLFQRNIFLEERNPQLASISKEMALIKGKIVREILEHTSEERNNESKRALTELFNHLENLEKVLSKEYSNYLGEDNKIRNVSLGIISKSLPINSFLVEFIRLPLLKFGAVPAKRESRWKSIVYVAFVLRARSSRVKLINLGEVVDIDRKILNFRNAVTKGQEVDYYGTMLMHTVFEPLMDEIGDNGELLLSPDGLLGLIPFQALPDGEGKYLIDHYEISYLNAGRDILRFSEDYSSFATDPLILGSPDFNLQSSNVEVFDKSRHKKKKICNANSTDLVMEPIENTVNEAKTIARMLGVTPLLREKAQKVLIIGHESPCILHLATHGFFFSRIDDHLSDDIQELSFEAEPAVISNMDSIVFPSTKNPMICSGLALSGFNRWINGDLLPSSIDNGVLTAEEVSTLNLRGTELVVLSACDTGLGKIQNGDGIFGLRRAFLLAGAQAIVMSLWKVPDRETEQLMTRFYANLLEGMTKQKALKEAQMFVRTTCNADPLYWGAFICEGNVRILSDRIRTLPK